MKYLVLTLSVLILLCFNNQLLAQRIIPCHTVEAINHYHDSHPGYKEKIESAYQNAISYVRDHMGSRGVGDTVYKIPVVVHIVYTATDDNIPDSLVYSQIEVLNKDYNRINDDATQTRDIFKPIAGSMRIEFFLATTDPNGNPTTGIIRKLGTPALSFVGFNAFQDNVKNPTEGDAPWNTDRYLNIWVCNLNTIPLGVLGYAYPPTGAANWPPGSETDSAKQGVVIDYTAFGRNNPYVLDPGVSPGRTCVHEVGHYLGLRHIWADEAACAEDDGIDDTPKAGDQSNFDCDTTKNTCVDVGTDFPDMIENYMDYSDERCQNMFTKMQTDIMLFNLITLRPYLAQKHVIGVSTDDIAAYHTIQIMPNPASNTAILHFNLLQNTSATYAIYSIHGNMMQVGSVEQEYQTLDISNLPTGVYTVRVSSNSKTYHSRFVVQ